jgi:hypothetical protein
VKSFLIAAAVVALPTVASAQSVSTDCYMKKRSVHCYSSVRPSIGETIREIQELNQGRQLYGIDRDYRNDPKATAELKQLLEAKRVAMLDPKNHTPDYQTWKVRQFLAAGDCAGARAYAVATTSPAQVERVDGFCGKESK